MRRLVTGAVAALCCLPTLGGCGLLRAGETRSVGATAVTTVQQGQASTEVNPPSAAERLVLVSGRDDHGLLARSHVPAFDGPASGHVVGRIADGTLARVVRLHGEWLELETAEGPRVRGWVDDFHLRGVVHLVGPRPACRPRLSGAAPPEAGAQAVVTDLVDGRVRVRLVTDPARTGWLPRADVHELAPEVRECPDAFPGVTAAPRSHRHHHHHGGGTG